MGNDAATRRGADEISRRLIDPELLPGLDGFPQLPPLSDATIASVRAGVSDLADFQLPLEPGTLRTEMLIPGPAGATDIRLIVLKPEGLSAAAPALVFVHGGGYVIGKPEDSAAFCSSLAKTSGCVVILPSYRLAPEHQWPAPLEDLYVALEWVHEHAEELGIARTRVAVGGISAGGGHAAALAIWARNRGGPSIMHQLLLCPMLDDRQPNHPYVVEATWPRQADHYGWASLLGQEPGTASVPAEAVPGRVEDLSNLPAAYIGVGALDLFAESNVDYARRLMAGGVPTELHVFPGGFHGFEVVAPSAGISRLAIAESARSLKRAFDRSAV